MTEPADLSDAELCEAVAREVLGWRAVRQWLPDKSAFGYAEGDYGFKSSLEMNWSGIGQVVEAMRERDYSWGVEEYQYETPTQVRHTFRHKDETGPDFACEGTSFFVVDAGADPRAVFEAALAAVRSVET